MGRPVDAYVHIHRVYPCGRIGMVFAFSDRRVDADLWNREDRSPRDKQIEDARDASTALAGHPIACDVMLMATAQHFTEGAPQQPDPIWYCPSSDHFWGHRSANLRR